MTTTEPTATTDVERYEPRTPGVLTEREMHSIEFSARSIAALDPRMKAITDVTERKEAAIALAITLHNLGLPVTVLNAKKIHMIQGDVMESAQLLIGLLEARGHEVRVVEEGDERAVVRGWRHGGGEPHQVIYTVDQARRSHALDEWVEKWTKDQGGKWRLEAKLIIRVDGEVVNAPWPKWAEEQIARGRVKRFDAWHDYRSDMLVNRAVRRLAKRMGGDALLGVGLSDEDEAGERIDPPAPSRSAPETPSDDETHDDDIVDAELVEDDTPPASGSAIRDESAETGSARSEGGGGGTLNLDPERPFTEE
jgi:hypothetical protein